MGKGYKGKNPRGGKAWGGCEEEEKAREQQMRNQNANVGLMPPSDSEDEDEDEKPSTSKAAPTKDAPGQNPNAGLLPPTDSDDEDEDSDSDESDAPLPEYLTQPSKPKKVVQEFKPDPEQIRKDIERLELIRKKREDDRIKRVKEEGWDRYAPISDTNRPPGYVPSDHPTKSKSKD